MRALAAAALTLLVLASAALAASSPPVAVRDPTGDAGKGDLDIARISFGRGSDGRLRASVTMARSWQPSDLLGRDGAPPGSICVRMWLGGRSSASSRPDYLACATVAADNSQLKASVMRERSGDLPERVGRASASKVSARTAIIRFAQGTIGRPAALDFAVEALPGGCPALECADDAPDAPGSERLVLRSSS